MNHPRILVLYYSRHGRTKCLAEEISRGVESIGDCEAILRTVPPIQDVYEKTKTKAVEDLYVVNSDLDYCDALILGSPSYFGNMSAPLKHFIDQTSPEWLRGALTNKPAGIFTSSSSMHGGQESTILSMMLPLLHHGMLIVGIPYHNTKLATTASGGTPYGASHIAKNEQATVLTKEEFQCARVLGQRVATVASALKSS